MNKQIHDTVVVLDFGAINSQLAAKIIRNCKVFCEVLPCSATAEQILALNPCGIVLQRGAAVGARSQNSEISTDFDSLKLPVFDMATREPTPKNIDAFLVDECRAEKDWTVEAFIEETVEEIRKEVGSANVLLAMSGGVDSSVCAVLLHRAIGSRLKCVFVDHGLMRKGEPQEVVTVFREKFGIDLKAVNAEQRFLAKLAGIVDPETKRKIIGEEFIRVFEEEARLAGNPEFLAQGTIYPDIIESGTEASGRPVKAHHNVGGLPKKMEFRGIVEPLKFLFKDEVRHVALALGIPESIALRQPFPGPGLGVRCIGELTKERLDILRDADAIFRKAIIERGLSSEVSQYFAILTAERSVGVADDARTYAYTIALRAVKTTDFMTAEAVRLPMELLSEVSHQITSSVKAVNRVVYDITNKPPATIEWE